jgi:hypothetical protein
VGIAGEVTAFCSPGPVVTCTTSSSHTDTSGVTWGRPSARTVVTMDSWAVSNTPRALAHGVAVASGSLNRSSSWSRVRASSFLSPEVGCDLPDADVGGRR